MVSQSDAELRLFDSVKAKYGKLHGDFDEDDRYLAGEFGGNIIPSEWTDQGLTVIKLPTLNDAVGNAADHILTDPRISVPVRPTDRDVEKERQIAESKRQFHELFWARMFEDYGDPLGRGKRSLVKGKLVLKLEIDWDLIPKLPDEVLSGERPATPSERRTFRRNLEKVARSSFIWKLSVVPKKTVFEDPAHPEDPPFVFEHYTTTVHEATQRWPHLAEHLSDRDDPMEELDYKEYWSKPKGDSRGKFIQWIEDERVHEAINPYSWETPLSTSENPDWTGRLPYIIGESGWGDVDEDTDPYDRYVSITRNLRSLHEAEVRQLTSVEAWLRLYIWRPVIGRNMPSVEDGEQEFRLGPAAFWNLSEDQSLEPLNFGDIPLAPFQFLQKVQAESDRHSRFGALGGVAQRGVDTATEADQNTRNAATMLSGPVNTLRRMVTRINTFVEQDVEKVLEAPVTLYGATAGGPSEVTLKPSDIRGFYYTQVQLETADEAALNMRNLRIWGDAYSRFPLTARTAMTMAGIANPQGEIDERKLEDLERSPQAMQVLLMTMLSMLGQPGSDVLGALRESLPALQGAGGGGGNGRSEQAPAPNRVEQLRQETRNSAIEAQPDRQMF